jgi:RNA polymerase sigma-70 factor, ECF subfamily
MSATDDARTAARDDGGIDDAEIVDRVRSGDIDLFALLVARYQRQVLALGYRFHRTREDAEDFAQDVFLQAFRKLDTFRGTGRFYSWLMRIAYNRGSRRACDRPRCDSAAAAPVVDPDPRPDEALERAEARDAVAGAVAQLPPRYADCIELYFFFDLSYEEVSAVTGFTLNTVRSHIRRAKLLLADRLSGRLAGERPSTRSGGRT